MNQSTLKWLVREVASACARTELIGSCRGVSFRLGRRNSPYVSHQQIDFAPARYNRALWVEFRDELEGIAIYPNGEPGEPAPGDWLPDQEATSEAENFDGEALQIPAVLVDGLLQALNAETGGLVPASFGNGVVTVVAVRRRLAGWTDDGRPVLATATGEGRTPASSVPEPPGADLPPDLLVGPAALYVHGYTDEDAARKWFAQGFDGKTVVTVGEIRTWLASDPSRMGDNPDSNAKLFRKILRHLEDSLTGASDEPVPGGANVVTISTVHRLTGWCRQGICDWLGTHFPGRESLTVAELRGWLSSHHDHGNWQDVARLVAQIATTPTLVE